ncbi:MAG: hypothetical protein H6Q07_3411, partial [Acidobacteria bacterium]|nr:hypothetical protein [Acidobacteriota bacterium]
FSYAAGHQFGYGTRRFGLGSLLNLDDSGKAQDCAQIQRVLEVKLLFQPAGSLDISRQEAGVDFECGGGGVLDGYADVHAPSVERAANQLLNFPFQELILSRDPGVKIQEPVVDCLNFNGNEDSSVCRRKNLR